MRGRGTEILERDKMASDVRQERRRRIVERGTDRMALITGQVRTLTSSPSLPAPSTPTHRQPHHAYTESSPSIMYSPNNDRHQINAIPEEATDNASASKLTKIRTINEYPGARNFHRRNKLESDSELKPDQPSPKTITPVTKTQESSVQRLVNPPNFFSSKRLNSCIISSERTRAICSLIITFLVITSNIDFPLFGFNIVSSDSFIASRPFYIILLTDMTIVLARMFRESASNGVDEAEEERKAASKEDGDNWDGAVKLLERGLVLYQAIRGIFIDCSVYLVVVICGLSLV